MKLVETAPVQAVEALPHLVPALIDKYSDVLRSVVLSLGSFVGNSPDAAVSII